MTRRRHLEHRHVDHLAVEPLAVTAYLEHRLVAALHRLLTDPTNPRRQAMARAAIRQATRRPLPDPTRRLLRALTRLAARPTEPLQRALAAAVLADHPTTDLGRAA